MYLKTEIDLANDLRGFYFVANNLFVKYFANFVQEF